MAVREDGRGADALRPVHIERGYLRYAEGSAMIDMGNTRVLCAATVEASPPLGINLAAEIRTIIWATGYHPDYSWLEVPVLDRKGLIRHDGGVADSPGLYLMGMQFLRRRKSALIDGAGDDARDLSAHLAAYLAGEPCHARLGAAR